MGESPVDEDTVRQMAALSRIDLDEDSIDQFRQEFVEILEYFQRLDDAPEIEPPESIETSLRDDITGESLSQADALQNASESEDGYFKGPPVG